MRDGVRGQSEVHQFEGLPDFFVDLVKLFFEFIGSQEAPKFALLGMLVHDGLHAP